MLVAATDTVVMPQPKPRAVGQHLIVPSIRSWEVVWAQRSGVRTAKIRSNLSISEMINSTSISRQYSECLCGPDAFHGAFRCDF